MKLNQNDKKYRKTMDIFERTYLWACLSPKLSSNGRIRQFKAHPENVKLEPPKPRVVQRRKRLEKR